MNGKLLSNWQKQRWYVSHYFRQMAGRRAIGGHSQSLRPESNTWPSEYEEGAGCCAAP